VPEPIDLKIATRYNSNITDFDNNDHTKWLFESTNVRPAWDILPEKEYIEKLNLMFSSGSALPDVIMRCDIPNDMQLSLGTQGLVIPLNGLIEKWRYNFKELCDTYPDVLNQITAPDGNIYAMPNYGRNEAIGLSQRLWINKTFMDTLGITKIPETTDDFYNYLVAVRDGDPNGNGKADEIPMIGNPHVNSEFGNVDGFLMSPFIYNEGTNNPNQKRRVYLDENNKIHASYMQPEWKQGLEWMRKLCSEGLLAADSFTLDAESVRSYVEFEDALLVGSITNMGYHNFSNVQGERRKNYVVVPPLTGPDGNRTTYYAKYAGVGVGQFLITKACEIPDIAMKFCDFMYTEENWMRGRYGVPDRDWETPPEGTIAVDGTPARYRELELKWGQPQNALLADRTIQWTRKPSYGRAKDLNDPWELESVLWEAKMAYEPYRFENVVPPLFIDIEDARRYSELHNLITPYVEQNIAYFTTGVLNLDTDWDKYLSELESMGVNEMLEIMQKTLDRQWGEFLAK
jgi:putative aldouronate transport system substrate-binding protein